MHYLRNHRCSLSHLRFYSALTPTEDSTSTALKHLRAENQGLASQRIVVEHAHAGLKRYRILSDRLRMHNWGLYDVILGVCAGLWNFHLSC